MPQTLIIRPDISAFEAALAELSELDIEPVTLQGIVAELVKGLALEHVPDPAARTGGFIVFKLPDGHAELVAALCAGQVEPKRRDSP